MPKREYTIQKYYQLGGIDTSSTLVDRNPISAVSMNNLVSTVNDGLRLRHGTDIVANVNSGLADNWPDLPVDLDGYAPNSIYNIGGRPICFLNALSHDSQLGRFIEIEATSSHPLIKANLVSGGPFYITAYSGSTVVCSINVGTGLEGSPTSISSLITSLNGYGVTLTVDATYTSLPAAFMNSSTVASATPNFGYAIAGVPFEGNDTVTLTPFSTRLKYISTGPQEGYIASGGDITRIVGNGYYQSGVLTPSDFTASVVTGSSSAAAGDYQYLVINESIGRDGVILSSDPFQTNVVSLTSPSTQYLKLSFPANRDFRPNSDCQSNWQIRYRSTSQTVTLTDGVGTIECSFIGVVEGDYIFITTNSQGLVSAKVIDIIDATHVSVYVLDSAITGLDLNGNDYASPSRSVIYRSKVGPSSYYYYLHSWCWHASAAAYDFLDTIADSSLGAEYIFPDASRRSWREQYFANDSTWETQLPSISCIAMYQNSLLIAEKSRIRFSEAGGWDYFPTEFKFDVNLKDPSSITGIFIMDGSFLVFKENSITRVTGGLVDGSFTVEVLIDGVGSLPTYNAILEVEGVCYFMDMHGFFSFDPSNGLVNISKQVDSFFPIDLTSLALPYSSYYSKEDDLITFSWFQRHFAYSPTKKEWYPISATSGTVFNLNHLSHVGDSSLDSNTLLPTETFCGDNDGAPQGIVSKRTSVRMDHGVGIAYSYLSAYETLGEPSVFKKAIRMKLDSDAPGGEDPSFSCTMRMYCDGDASYSTEATKSITSKRGAIAKVRKQKAQKFQFSLTGTTASQSDKVTIAGMSIDYSTPYRVVTKE